MNHLFRHPSMILLLSGTLATAALSSWLSLELWGYIGFPPTPSFEDLRDSRIKKVALLWSFPHTTQNSKGTVGTLDDVLRSFLCSERLTGNSCLHSLVNHLRSDYPIHSWKISIDDPEAETIKTHLWNAGLLNQIRDDASLDSVLGGAIIFYEDSTGCEGLLIRLCVYHSNDHFGCLVISRPPQETKGYSWLHQDTDAETGHRTWLHFYDIAGLEFLEGPSLFFVLWIPVVGVTFLSYLTYSFIKDET